MRQLPKGTNFQFSKLTYICHGFSKNKAIICCTNNLLLTSYLNDKTLNSSDLKNFAESNLLKEPSSFNHGFNHG